MAQAAPEDGDTPMKDDLPADFCAEHHPESSLANMRLMNRYFTVLWKEGRAAAQAQCLTPDMSSMMRASIQYRDPQKGTPLDDCTAPRQAQGTFPSFSGERFKDLLAAYTRATKTTHTLAWLQSKCPDVDGVLVLLGNFVDLLGEMAPLFGMGPTTSPEARVPNECRCLFGVHRYMAEMKAQNLVLLTIQMLAQMQYRYKGDSRLELVFCNTGSALAHLAEFFELWCQKDFIE